MNKKIIIIWLLFVNLIGFSQNNTQINQFDNNGLKVGYWNEESSKGNYIVIPVDTSLNYKKAIELSNYYSLDQENNFDFTYSNKTNIFISVRDGEWIIYSDYRDNKETYRTEYKAGYLHKQKVTNSNSSYRNKTTVYTINNSKKLYNLYLDDDSILSNNTLYCQDGIKNVFGRDRIYYPKNSLNIEDAELDIQAYYTANDTVYVKFIAKRKMSIDSITSPCKQIRFYHKSQKSNLILTPNKIDSIGIIYTPTRKQNYKNTYFVIYGSDLKYKVFLSLKSWDIGFGCFKNNTPIIIKKDSISQYCVHLYTHDPYYLLEKEYILDKEWITNANYLTKNKIQQWYMGDMGGDRAPDFKTLNKGTYYLYLMYLGRERKILGPKRIIIE